MAYQSDPCSFTVRAETCETVHAPCWKTCRKFVVLMEKIPGFSSCSHSPISEGEYSDSVLRKSGISGFSFYR